MTNQELYLLIGLALFTFAAILSAISNFGGKSHRGATEPSQLPPLPERPPFIGPWYLKIQGPVETPPKYVKADIIEHLDYDYEGNLWLTLNTGEVKRYAGVEEFKMMPIKNVTDFCWSEDLDTEQQ